MKSINLRKVSYSLVWVASTLHKFVHMDIRRIVYNDVVSEIWLHIGLIQTTHNVIHRANIRVRP